MGISYQLFKFSKTKTPNQQYWSYLIICECHWNSTSHKASPPNDHLKWGGKKRQTCQNNLVVSTRNTKKDTWEKFGHTCCLNEIFSYGDFLVKLDKKDKGKTNAALPRSIRPNNTELAATDVPGLQKKSDGSKWIVLYNNKEKEKKSWKQTT